MSRLASRILHTGAGALLAILSAALALADDTEIFRSQAEATGALPNVLFVMDTSGSMDTKVQLPRPPYDPSETYPGSCNANHIYYANGSNLPNSIPSCSNLEHFPAGANGSLGNAHTCDAAENAIASSGYWIGVAAQLRGNGNNRRWRSLSTNNSLDYVECKADDNLHGQNAAGNYRIENSSPWWTTSGNSNLWSDLTNSYVFYSGNYINWAKMSSSASEQTRLKIMQDVAKNLVNSLNNVNIGLMRYNNPPSSSSNTEGGSVIQAIGNINTHRAHFIDAIDEFVAEGNTPLTETLYEAQQYFAGRSVDFGNQSAGPQSIASSRAGNTATGATYKSPIEYQCQKNYIVHLTDGLPVMDTSANSSARIYGLPGFKYLSGAGCGSTPGSSGNGGQCMDDLAGYLYTSDLSPLPGQQNVITYMIGFGGDPDLAATGTPYLNTVAAAGGTGKSYSAADADALTVTLQQIFSDILQTSSTFVTPAVSVNAFNRTQIQSDLYFNVFKASLGLHWPGNLKKYKLSALNGATLVDADNRPAVDISGFFANGTRSIWSASADGGDVTQGGAASRLPAPASRKLYTYMGSNATLAHASNAVATSNAALTDKIVGAGTSTSSCSTACAEAINWARGADVDDDDGDDDMSEQASVPFMGDPLHGKPAVVTYGGTTGSPDENDSVVFVPTNDGFLHAIAGKSDTSTGKGQELWAFIPKELLHRLNPLRNNADTVSRTYGLDGDIRALKFDINQDGIVDAAAGDFVWLFFGMRMGEDSLGKSYYYALNVTDRNNPKLLWVKGPDQLPGLGQTWSPPAITRVNVGPNGSLNTNSRKFVLIFGGGYDMAAEDPSNTTETVGNRIFIVDAQTGGLLWYAGNTSAAHLNLPKMSNAIPGRINVIDLDGDQFADRMYAADLGGRIWRFDIYNGKSPTDATDPLVTGGAIAQLGVGNVTGATAQDNRRFYNAPDVALIQRRGADPFFNLAIGSGYRGHPLNTTVTDRFYSVRDKQPFARFTQAGFDSMTPVLDANLTDITANPGNITVAVDAPGWKLSMTAHGTGEKVLAEATTVNYVILFTSFQPVAAGSGDPCFPANLNRAYALSVGNGGPALDFDEDGVIDGDDLSVDLRQAGIAGEVNVTAIRRSRNDDDNDDETGGTDPDGGSGGSENLCQVGVEVLGKCVQPLDVIRTFWQRNDVQ